MGSRGPFRREEPLLTTNYFRMVRNRPDRSVIPEEWIRKVMQHPEHEEKQKDGRIRRWAKVPEAGGKYLRVILLADGVTVHNFFLDRGFLKK